MEVGNRDSQGNVRASQRYKLVFMTSKSEIIILIANIRSFLSPSECAIFFFLLFKSCLLYSFLSMHTDEREKERWGDVKRNEALSRHNFILGRLQPNIRSIKLDNGSFEN